MWDIKTILKDFIKTKDIQEFINHRFKSGSSIIISKKPFKYVATDYALFGIDVNCGTVEQVDNDYSLDDLRSTDIVLDIGACIGAFSLKVCKKVYRVFAVEPLMTEELKRNIELNQTKNITVLSHALGVGEQDLEWMGMTKRINCMSLEEIVKLCGGHVDFLKVDCEGGEWSILPEELVGIRRIEMEIHSFKGMPKTAEFERILQKAGFDYKKETLSKELMLIHAQASIEKV